MSDLIPDPSKASAADEQFKKELDLSGVSHSLQSLKKDVDQMRERIPKLTPLRPIQQASIIPPFPESLKKLVQKNPNVHQDLLKLYLPSLPRPGKSPGKKDAVIVWRGCRADQLVGMIEKGSAGGREVDVKVAAPQESDVLGQVGEQASLPEFTTDIQIAERFGRGAFVIACEIKMQYLAKGSVAEKGVVCSPEAPVRVVGWKFGSRFL